MARREARTPSSRVPRARRGLQDAPLGAPSPRFIRGGRLARRSPKGEGGDYGVPRAAKNTGDDARPLSYPSPERGGSARVSERGGVIATPPPAARNWRLPSPASGGGIRKIAWLFDNRIEVRELTPPHPEEINFGACANVVASIVWQRIFCRRTIWTSTCRRSWPRCAMPSRFTKKRWSRTTCRRSIVYFVTTLAPSAMAPAKFFTATPRSRRSAPRARRSRSGARCRAR